MTDKRIPMKSGYEYDALTKARKWYKYLDKAGVVKKIKRQYNKRFRKHAKAEAKKSGSEEL